LTDRLVQELAGHVALDAVDPLQRMPGRSQGLDVLVVVVAGEPAQRHSSETQQARRVAVKPFVLLHIIAAISPGSISALENRL